jgi:hypothetical protein
VSVAIKFGQWWGIGMELQTEIDHDITDGSIFFKKDECRRSVLCSNELLDLTSCFFGARIISRRIHGQSHLKKDISIGCANYLDAHGLLLSVCFWV